MATRPGVGQPAHLNPSCRLGRVVLAVLGITCLDDHSLSPTSLPPGVVGVDLPVIRRLLRGRTIVASASWLTRRFIRRRLSMAAEAWHKRTGLGSPCTDCGSPAESVLLSVLLPAFHSSSVTADGMALPVLGCLLAFKALGCATLPPPFQMPWNSPKQYLDNPLALCSP